MIFDESTYLENSIYKFTYAKIDGMNILDLPILDSVIIDNNLWGRIDKILNRYYSGDLWLLKIILDFNHINDVSEIKLGMTLRLPDISELEKYIVINDILDTDIVPGVNSDTSSLNNNLNNPNNLNKKETIALPKLKIKSNKGTYDPVNGKLTFG